MGQVVPQVHFDSGIMKFLIVLALLSALLYSNVDALDCYPHGNNKPVCEASNVGVPVRNFWDPTRYWLCAAAGEDPLVVLCDTETLYDPNKQECIPYSEWQWVQPCPDDVAAKKN